MNPWLARLQSLLPEFPPATVERAVQLLRQGLYPEEVWQALGLKSECRYIGQEIIRTGMFLVQHRLEKVEVLEPLQVERTNERFTIKINGQQLDITADDCLFLLSTLYEYRREIIELTHLVT